MALKTLTDILNNPVYCKGSNLLDAKKIFEERVKYNKKHAYKENSINIQNERTLYGRVDLNQNFIYPNMEKIINLRSNGKLKEHMVFPFVNDAYNEMELKINELLRLGKIKPNEIIPFKTQNSFSNFENSYKQNIIGILDLFVKFTRRNGQINKIYNFRDFINYFIEFTTIRNVSLTATKFCLTNNNILSTGLCIELLKQPLDLDVMKELFYENKNYPLYNSLLLTYGFSVDKHAPWRIIFNIDSSIAHTYMSKYNIENTEDLFHTFYKRTYETELSLLLDIMMEFYNTKLCELRPYVFKTETTQTKNGIKTYNKTSYREKITEESLFKLIPELTLLKLYFYIRLREESFNLSQEEFDSLMTKITILHQTSGVNAVNNFVNNYTKFITNDGANPSLSLTRETVTRYNNLNVYFRV